MRDVLLWITELLLKVAVDLRSDATRDAMTQCVARPLCDVTRCVRRRFGHVTCTLTPHMQCRPKGVQRVHGYIFHLYEYILALHTVHLQIMFNL